MPDFVIVGAQKGGTTSLFRLLSQHPGIRPADRKELHYFSLFYDRGLGWYRDCFPATREGEITGEGSPYYLFHPHAPERMAQTIPRARLIAMLRNPVDRAYSHWNHEVTTVSRMYKRTVEPLGFEDAVEAEEERLRGEEARMLEDPKYASFNHQHYSYLSRGVYVDQLARFSRFFDAKQMLVLRSEDFFERTSETLGRIAKFLDLPVGLPEWEPESRSLENIVLKGEYERGMSLATRRRLEDYFEPHNQRLRKYLGQDFGW